MYTIEKLNELSDAELKDVAKTLDLKVEKGERKDWIYSILDAQAEQTSLKKPARKRQRVGDKVQTEAVYTADKKGTAKSVDAPQAKRKRGRPSKAELEARAKEAQQSLFQQLEPATPEIKQPEVVEEKAAEPVQLSIETPVEVTPAVITLEENKETEQEPVPAFVAEQLDKQTQEKQKESKTEVKDVAKQKEDGATLKFENTIKVNDSLYILNDITDVDPTTTPKGGDFFKNNNSTYVSRLKNNEKPKASLADNKVPETDNAPARAQVVRPKELNITIDATGVLELLSENSGVLRSADYNYLPSPDDVSVNGQLIRQYALKAGDTIEGQVRMPRANEKNYVLTNISRVNGLEPKIARERVGFEHLTPLFPDEKFKLCSGKGDSLSCRIVDLFTPIGKGQRALIVAQPKTGKTWLMKDIANAIARNNPNTYMMMLLIDERPEEVTDMIRTVKAEVIASTFDEPAAHHVRIAKLVLEKAKRMVECGHDVVIFLDSITRLARAYNTVSPSSGKVLTGGVEANSLQHPKRFFGAARNIEGGGSLTIIATALIDTGSKMDEVIFEEFKGTGNMELQLERNLSNKRIYPSVNLVASSTRRDDLLHDELTQHRMWLLRKYIADMNPVEAMNTMTKFLEGTANNEEFIATMNTL